MDLREYIQLQGHKLTKHRIGDSDDFITELWKVHLRVKQEGYVQVGSLNESLLI